MKKLGRFISCMICFVMLFSSTFVYAEETEEEMPFFLSDVYTEDVRGQKFIYEVVEILYPYYPAFLPFGDRYRYAAYELGYLDSRKDVNGSALTYELCMSIMDRIVEQQEWKTSYDFGDVELTDTLSQEVANDIYLYLEEMSKDGVKSFVKPLGNLVFFSELYNLAKFCEMGTNKNNIYNLAGVIEGDIVYSLDNEVYNQKEFTSYLMNAVENDYETVTFYIYRGEDIVESVLYLDSTIEYVYDKVVIYTTGDASVGALTYMDIATGQLSSLGHSISFGEGIKYPHISLSAYTTTVESVEKSVNGSVGSLVVSGYLEEVAYITENTSKALYGEPVYTQYLKTDTCADYFEYTDGNDIFEKGSARKGTAYMYTNVLGDFDYYEIEISDVNKTDSYDFEFKIVDKRIKEEFGGIVKGMSGTPIIQNDMYVGCVSGVFLNNVTSGYGQFE